MAFTQVTAAGISTGNSLTIQELNTVGVITAATVQVGSATTIHTTGIDLGSGNITSHNINSTGIITATGAVITGNLEVQGTTTTLDSLVTEVDKLEVAANNTNVAVAVTQSGTGDILNLFDGSTEVFTVLDGGNVGIGLTNPGERLNVVGSIKGQAGSTNFKAYNPSTSSGNPEFVFTQNTTVGEKSVAYISAERQDSGSNYYSSLVLGTTLRANDATKVEGIVFRNRGDNNSYLKLKTDGTDAIHIDGSQRVGIGTDNPGAQSSSANNLVIADFGGEGGITIKTNINSSGNIFFADTAATANGRIAYGHGTLDTGDYMRFYVANEEKLRINANGYIGIGTNTPDKSLTLGFDGALAQLELKRTNTNTTGGIGAINFAASDGHSVANIYALGDGDNEGAHIVFKTTSAAGESTPYGPNTFERLRITSSGNVGIGTDNPNGVKLHLQDSGSPGIRLVRDNAADYAFNLTASGTFYIYDDTADAHRLQLHSNGFIGNGNFIAQTPLDIVGSASSSILARPNTSSIGSEGDSSAVNNLLHLRMPYGSNPGAVNNNGARWGIKFTGRNDGAGYGNDDGKSASIYAVSEEINSGYNRKVGLAFYTSPFDANQVERLRIESDGTLFSKSPSDATPNFKFISDDTNWHGYLNQTVHGGTISSILSCGGTWTVNGTTYDATKDYNGSFGTAALIVHNQYNSTATGGELVFVTKANGSTTTDGAVTERFRINSTGNIAMPNGGAIYSSQSSYASITPSNNDWINIARVPYGAQIAGQVMIAWSSLSTPSCCHHGHMTFDLGSSHGPTYGYQWAASLEVSEAQAHNDYWFKEARLIIVTTEGSNWLYLQVKSSGTVASGSFRSTLLRSKHSPDASSHIQILTPVVDNSQSGSILRHLYLQYDGSQTRVTTPHAHKIQNALGGNTYNEGNLGVGGYLQTPYQPAFFCSKGSGTPSTGNITQWSTPFVNVGSHFDTTTGRFTAPVAGVYHLHFHGFIDATVTTPTNVQVDIRKNAVSLARQYTHRDSGWSTYYGPPMSITATVIAAVNDYFDLYFSHGMHANAGYYFGGYLIG